MAEDRRYLWEVQLSQGHWANLSSELATWYRYNYERESRTLRNRMFAEVLPIIDWIVDQHLTPRQRQVFRLYFQRQHTQVRIAYELGITQPTVSQHLNGKLRGGRRVGGALKKIRKVIHRGTLGWAPDSAPMKILMILDALLAHKMTRRSADKLLASEQG